MSWFARPHAVGLRAACATIVFAVLAAGCTVVCTVDPLWIPANAQTASQLAGEWRDPSDSAARITVRSLSDSGSVSIQWHDDENRNAYVGRTLAIDDVLILEVNLATLRTDDEDPGLRGFTFFRIWNAESRFSLSSLNVEGLRRVALSAHVSLSMWPECEERGEQHPPARSRTGEPDRARKYVDCLVTIEGEPVHIVALFRNHAGEIFDPASDEGGLIRAPD